MFCGSYLDGLQHAAQRLIPLQYPHGGPDDVPRGGPDLLVAVPDAVADRSVEGRHPLRRPLQLGAAPFQEVELVLHGGDRIR